MAKSSKILTVIRKIHCLSTPENLDYIIDTLTHYKEDISKNQKIENKYFIKDSDKKTNNSQLSRRNYNQRFEFTIWVSKK